MLSELVSRLGPTHVLTSPEDLVAYSYDGTAILRQRPLAVVLPGNTEEVAAVLSWARQHRVPVVTRGSGTGLSGGSLPVPGGLVLVTGRLNRILEVDTENLTLLTEPGVLTQQIFEAADAVGLFYPPDPGSMKISTIGGNVAENSGGLRGLKYGVTRDYVIGMEVVLASGEVVWLGGKNVKDVAGYNLRDLFIGSEGTLGVITRVLLKLIPKPGARHTLLASFSTMEDAASAVSAIIARQIIPCTMEFLDRKTAHCVEAFSPCGLPQDAEAVLLIETDGHPAAASAEATAVEAVLHAHRPLAVRRAADLAEGVRLATARRSAFSALARVRPTTILEDVTVPRSKLALMVKAVQEIATRHRLQVAVFGHFGDGNLHPTFLTDERDADEMHRVELALQEVVNETLRLGGTITGEHGVGVAKKAFLRQQTGDASLALLRTIKRSLDPENLLNPGKIFDL